MSGSGCRRRLAVGSLALACMIGLDSVAVAGTDRVLLKAAGERLEEIRELAQPASLTVDGRAGNLARPMLLCSIVDFRPAPALPEYELVVRAWSREPGAAASDPIRHYSDPFVLRDDDILTVAYEVDDVPDLRLLLSDVDRQTGGFNARWLSVVRAMADDGSGGRLQLALDPVDDLETIVEERHIPGVLLDQIRDPIPEPAPALLLTEEDLVQSGMSRELARQLTASGPLSSVPSPPWYELHGTASNAGVSLARARATLGLWPDAEQRAERFVPAADAFVHFVASLRRLPHPEMFAPDGSPAALSEIEQRQLSAAGLGWSIESDFLGLLETASAYNDPQAPELPTDFTSPNLPDEEEISVSPTRMARASLSFYQECPELLCAVPSQGDLETRLVVALVSLAALPREQAGEGLGMLDLACPMRSDPDFEELSAAAAETLHRVLRRTGDHPYLSWLSDGERQEVTDLLAAGTLLRRAAFVDLLFVERAWMQENALTLLEQHSSEALAPEDQPLLRKDTVDRALVYATGMNDVEIDEPWDRRCRRVGARLLRLALAGQGQDRSPAEREVAAHAAQRIEELRVSRELGRTTQAEDAFLDVLDGQLSSPKR